MEVPRVSVGSVTASCGPLNKRRLLDHHQPTCSFPNVTLTENRLPVGPADVEKRGGPPGCAQTVSEHAMRILQYALGIPGFAVLTCLLISGAVYSPIVAAKTSVSWSQKSMSVMLQPGQSMKKTVTLTAQQNIDASEVRVVPALAPYVQVLPPAIPALAAGQSVDFALVFAVPVDALPTKTSGAIQLRRTDAIYRSQNAVAVPLPITLDVTWPKYVSVDNISFSYPAFGMPSLISSVPIEGAISYEVQLQTSDRDFVRQFSITIIPNPSLIPLLSWFDQNVDVNGLLFASQSFAFTAFTNGGEGLFRVGSIPTEIAETSGPVAEAYARSPSGNSILVVRFSHVNDLFELGVRPPKTQDFLRALLDSFVAP